jgi:hypothetical protein
VRREALYHHTGLRGSHPKKHAHDICVNRPKSQCPALNLKATEVEAMTEAEFLARVGHTEVLEREDIPAENHSRERASGEEAIGHLKDQYTSGTPYQGAAGADRFARA